MNYTKKIFLLTVFLVFAFNVKSQISFTEITGTTFPPLQNGEMEFADFDNDGDLDLILTGEGEPFVFFSYTPITVLYINDGTGEFTLVSGLSIDSLTKSTIATGDIDNDGDIDVFISGMDKSGNIVAQIYTNNGNAEFTLTGNDITGIIQGDAAFGDIDGDNDLDLIVSGYTGSGYNTSLYINDGSGSFSLATGTPFSGTNYASVKFLDIDNDNDLDVIIAGDNGSTPFTELYSNDGNGNFSLVGGTPFDGASYGGIDVSDVDNDNDIDIVISGYNGSTEFTNLYLNDGTGVYTLATGSSFTGVSYASVQFVDFDLDNDKDLIISGYNGGTTSRYTILYENDGSGIFTAVGSIPFAPTQQFRNKFADIDGDNDLDFYLSGSSNGGAPDNAKMYRNNHCSAPITGIDTRSECSPYTWIDGITYTADNNTATYTLTNAAGCDSLVTLNLTINSADTSVTVEPAKLTANASDATYQWVDCNNNYSPVEGDTNQVFVPASNSSYAVIVTENGCTDTSYCYNITTVGIIESSKSMSISVYPNPFRNSTTLNTDVELKKAVLTIYNSTGQSVKHLNNISGHTFILNRDNLPEGLYFIQLSQDNQLIMTDKLVIMD